ncbi:MAG: glycosyltransferase [Acidimicrobiales bacterium]
MRVLLLHSPYRQAGGEDTVVAAEAALLAGAGHEVRVVQRPNQATVRAGAALLAAPWNPAAARLVRRELAAWRPDVCHVHNTWFSLSPAAPATASRAGVPVVSTLHNYRLVCADALLFRDGRPCEDCLAGSPWQGLRHRCYHGSLSQSALVTLTTASGRRAVWDRGVDAFLVYSEFAMRRFLAGGLPAARLRLRPNFTADPGERPLPPSASRRVVFAGRLTAVKGVAQLLEAWRAAAPSGLQLAVIGDGPMRRALQERVPPGVCFLGQLSREALLEELSSARALVFPSLCFEAGQPMVLLEAMAAGVPVLASDRGGAAELVGEDGWGVRVAAGDTRAWATALSALADDGWVDRAGALGRGRYLSAHTPAHGLASLEDAYRWAISRRELAAAGAGAAGAAG